MDIGKFQISNFEGTKSLFFPKIQKSGSLNVVLAPEKVNNNEKEEAGIIVTFFLVFGLALGSLTGFACSFFIA